MTKPVNFICAAPGAQSVSICGDFNDWNPNSEVLTRQPDGSWLGQVQLAHGSHHYVFVVDGQAMLDPRAQGIARNETWRTGLDVDGELSAAPAPTGTYSA